MKNDILLTKYQRKLSIYFALFVLFSLWMTQGIFTISSYVTDNLHLINKMESRVSGIKNILENKMDYFSKFKSNDDTLRLVIEKSLQDVTLYENNKKVLGTLDKADFENAQNIVYSKNYIFYQTSFQIEKDDYFIIIQALNDHSYFSLLHEIILFILFSLPFSIFFYFLGYFFVGKNLRPIQETIVSLEDFGGNLNHEIKTPLAEIVSTLSLTKRMKTDYDKAIDQSLGSAQKINKILDSMQGFIHLIDASYKKERLDLVENLKIIIQEYEPLAKKKNIRIQSHFSQDSHRQKINKAHLEICVGNILKNAIKYSHESGVIDVFFDKGKLIVRDSGVGIESKNLIHIFDRYFRENYSKEEGYGLGLALVKKIVDRNAWKITIESQKNRGTTVTLIFTQS